MNIKSETKSIALTAEQFNELNRAADAYLSFIREAKRNIPGLSYTEYVEIGLDDLQADEDYWSVLDFMAYALGVETYENQDALLKRIARMYIAKG